MTTGEALRWAEQQVGRPVSMNTLKSWLRRHPDWPGLVQVGSRRYVWNAFALQFLLLMCDSRLGTKSNSETQTDF